jgi:hypothetical protein
MAIVFPHALAERPPLHIARFVLHQYIFFLERCSILPILESGESRSRLVGFECGRVAMGEMLKGFAGFGRGDAFERCDGAEHTEDHRRTHRTHTYAASSIRSSSGPGELIAQERHD